MFAILINESNLEKITKLEGFTTKDERYVRDMYFDKFHFLVTGYVLASGELLPWTVFPAFVLHQLFAHDPEKIQYDWDQIVRK